MACMRAKIIHYFSYVSRIIESPVTIYFLYTPATHANVVHHWNVSFFCIYFVQSKQFDNRIRNKLFKTNKSTTYFYSYFTAFKLGLHFYGCNCIDIYVEQNYLISRVGIVFFILICLIERILFSCKRGCCCRMRLNNTMIYFKRALRHYP